MGRTRGRPKRGSLVDMGIYPNDECYQPPPAGDCESVPLPAIDLDEGHRIGFTRYYRKGTAVLIYFGINQSVRVGETDDWSDVARIDCSHGTVHRHQFTQSGLNRQEVLEDLTVQRGEQTINRWYERASRIMLEEWQENLRRWEA